MTEYYAFYDNMGLGQVVPVEFSSQKQAQKFIDEYEYFGEYKQFNWDHHGNNKDSFVEWLDEKYPILTYHLSRRPQIIKYKDGESLFRYMMSMFGLKVK